MTVVDLLEDQHRWTQKAYAQGVRVSLGIIKGRRAKS